MIVEVFGVLLIVLLAMLIKTEIVIIQRNKIIAAIFKYIENENTLGNTLFSRMESEYSTFFRVWDWGYKRILPKEYYQLIEKYIDN